MVAVGPGAWGMEEWDDAAAEFDEQPDHGLRDRVARTAWSDLLLNVLPPPPAAVVDLGCGTGTLAVLLAEAGYAVRALDSPAQMLAAARAKAVAAGVAVALEQGDAADPPYPPASCDVVLARHVLWLFPDPGAVLARWTRLLGPQGRLVLVEGRWSTGAGLTAAEAEALVLRHRAEAVVHRLEDPRLWGEPVPDERYLLLSPR